jgi:hypothetical protein
MIFIWEGAWLLKTGRKLDGNPWNSVLIFAILSVIQCEVVFINTQIRSINALLHQIALQNSLSVVIHKSFIADFPLMLQNLPGWRCDEKCKFYKYISLHNSTWNMIGNCLKRVNLSLYIFEINMKLGAISSIMIVGSIECMERYP